MTLRKNLNNGCFLTAQKINYIIVRCTGTNKD